MKRQALVFVAPGAVEVVDEPCPVPGAGELLVKALTSAVSAGTELLAYRGQLPADMVVDETLPALAGTFRYPFRYGYAAVGTVTAVGAGVGTAWVGRRVFAFAPHASAFVVPAGEAFAVPAGIGDEVAALYASAETACNLVLDGRPQLGERVAVFGQGMIGALLAAQLARFPLETLLAIEPDPARAATSQRLPGVTVVATASEARARLGPGADLAYEVSGQPAVLDHAIALTASEGRVVVGSFYGDKRAPLTLGGHFHRGRLQLISSQVSHIAPQLTGRWDRARRTAAAWRLLAGGDHAGALITHRVPFREAPAAYRLLDAAKPGVGQVILTHEPGESS